MPEIVLHPELINLVPREGKGKRLSEESITQLANDVVDEYEQDLKSRAEWEEKHREWADIYYQQDKPATTEREWGSKQSIPLLTEACNQFAARCRKAFFPNKDFVTTSLSSLGSFPADMDPEQVMQEAQMRMQRYLPAVERVRKHMNYILTIKNPGYKQKKDALWLSLAVHGSVFTKAYWDVITKQPRVDTVRAEDLVVPYNAGPVPIEELPRKTHKLFWSRLKTIQLANIGFFNEPCTGGYDISQHIGGTTQASDEANGVEVGSSLSDKSYSDLCFILEQHRFWEIDGIIVPVIVWVDYYERKVKRLSIRYETDDNGNPINDRMPIEYFTHYKFLENPDGFYGYGYGHMLGSVNLAINDGMRNSLDASLLATEGNMSGFISQRLVPQDDAGENIKLNMGEFTVVPDNIENIDSGIKTMSFPGPTEALVNLVQFLDQRGQRLGSITEASTGQVDKIRQSNALMTELEQALELPSNIHMRIADSLTDELMKVYRLNRVNMTDSIVFVVKETPEIVTKEDYSLDAIITPSFDPKMSTLAQKISRAQTELDAVLKNPMAQQDPNVINNAFRRFFEAIESENIDELIPQAPSQSEPERIDDQRVENMMYLMPESQMPNIGVFPDQDHQEHIAVIDEFVNSPYAAEIDPAMAAALKDHRQKHVAYLYGTEVGVNEQSGQEPEEAASYGMGPVEGDEGGFGNVDEQIQADESMGSGGIMGEAT